MKYLQKKLKKIKKNLLSKKAKIIYVALGCMLLLMYITALIFSSKIETFLTFPGKDINLKEIGQHPVGIVDAEFYDITSESGENIHGLFIDNNAEKTVYYFHGNAAPMEYFYTEMRYIADLGYNLMSYDFPGYGKSTGEPTQQQIQEFSQKFYTHISKEKSLEEKNIIIWGYSIGTAIAIDFAQDRDFDSMILFAPLASRYDMSSKLLGFPLQKLFFMSNSYVSKETIKKIDEPTLIIHGNKDVVVPFEQGKQVYENSPAEKKQFIEVDNLGHSFITETYGDILSGYIQDFLSDIQLKQEKTFIDSELAAKLLGKFKVESYIKSLDLKTDTSFQKYVDPYVPFTQLGYIPEDLEYLDKTYIADSKGNGQMRKEANESLAKMAEHFFEDMGEKIVVVSTYRSYTYQAGIKARGCPDNLCAKAGYSEHQSGLAVDFWSASTQAYWDSSQRLTSFYSWLAENAHKYGFHNTYQNGLEIDGYEIEPWHWRYVGGELAKYLKENDITFAEFYYEKNEKQ